MEKGDRVIKVGRSGAWVEVVDPERKMLQVVVSVDGPEGRGKIILTQCAYGFRIADENGRDLGLIDFYYGARQGKPAGPMIQIVVDGMNEEILGLVKFYEKSVEISIDKSAVDARQVSDGAMLTFASTIQQQA